MAVRPLSLWVASPGDTSEPPSTIGSWVVALLAEVTLFQRGTASDKIEPCRLEAGTNRLAVRCCP